MSRRPRAGFEVYVDAMSGESVSAAAAIAMSALGFRVLVPSSSACR
jgi:hypothetical protein